MSELSLGQQELAIRLIECGAFKTKIQSPNGEGFRLRLHDTEPDAPLSPFYINLRTPENDKPGPVDCDTLSMIGKEMANIAQATGIKFGSIVGIPTAGKPIAEHFHIAHDRERGKVNLLEVEKTENGFDATMCRNGQKEPVVLVDDAIASGGSKLKMVEALKPQGLYVRDVIVVLDHCIGGVDKLMRLTYRTHAIYKILQLIDLYFCKGLISPTLAREIREYVEGNS